MIPPAPSRIAHSTLLLAAVGLLLQGCSAIRFGGDPDHDLDGTWDGRLVVQGEGIPGTLAVAQTGEALETTFVASGLGLRAAGTGEVDDDGEVWMEMEYDLECPGTARLEGRVEDDDQRMTGTVEARDCTGVVNGSFTFTREGSAGVR